MDMQKLKDECIFKIEQNGYVLIDIDYPDLTRSQRFELIYKTSEDGKYFLDKTPYEKDANGNKIDGEWILRKSPDYDTTVNIENTNNTVRSFSWVNGIIAAITLLFIAGSFYYQSTDTTSKELRKVSKELQQNREELKRLQTSIMNLLSSQIQTKISIEHKAESDNK